MSFTEKISVLIDVNSQKATSGIKEFRSAIAEADGISGKFKAGLSALSSAFASPAGVAAGAAAAGAAAFKAVSDFSALGVEVGKFSDATGMSTEQSSRWVEVANDLGVSTESLQGALGKMNKNIDPALFAQLGISIAKTRDGATDVDATFLNVIDRLNGMTDATQKSDAAAKIFGRGWQDLSELIAQGSGKIGESLAGVSNAKVMSPEEVAKAREFRDSMAQLHDTVEELAITIGEKLAPALSRAVDNLSNLTGAAEHLGLDKLLEMPTVFEGVASAWDAVFGSDGGGSFVTTGIDTANQALQENAYVADLSAKGNEALADKVTAAGMAATDTVWRFDAMNAAISKNVDKQGAYLGVIAGLGDAKAALDDTSSSWVDQQRAINGAQQQVLNYLDQLGGIPASVRTEILTLLAQGNFQAVLDALNKLSAPRTVVMKVVSGVGATEFGDQGKFAAQAANEAAQKYASSFNDAVASTPAAHVGSGVHSGGGGGETAAEKAKREADAKIKEAQRVEDAKHEMGLISDAQYERILRKRLAHEKKFSEEYLATWREIQDLDKKQADAKAAADKKKADAAKAKADADKKARDEAKKKADEAESARKKAEQDRKDAERQALEDAAHRAIVAADISGATYMTINTAADPNAVVQAIQQYNRNNGPAPIKVQ